MNRRHFLATGARAAGSMLAWGALPSGLAQFAGQRPMLLPPGSPELKALAHAALDAARAAGARYADVVFRATEVESWGGFDQLRYGAPHQAFTQGVGIRALVGSAWGISGMDGVMTLDDVVRLGREAAALAGIEAVQRASTLELVPAPPVADGHWVTPVERDPFAVSPEEKMDFLLAVNDFIMRLNPKVGETIRSNCRFQRVDTTMASTDGMDYTQTTYTTDGLLYLSAGEDCLRVGEARVTADFLTPAGAGWEYIRAAPFREAAAALIETADRSRQKLEAEQGRHEVVFDAYAVAGILSATLGAATSLDRGMSMTAQGVGTSFLSDPLGMLGKLQVAAPSITITASRAMPRGAATVRWDDEGVVPREAILVKDGIITDFQTTRESANWLASYYGEKGRQPSSNGCAGRGRATDVPAQCPANLSLTPGHEALTFEDLVKSTKRGYAICGGRLTTDWQASSGAGRADRMYVIRDGQMGAAVQIPQYLFSTAELWKSIVALGGPSSARPFGITGEDNGLGAAHSVVAVPAKVRQLRITNV